MRSLRSHGALPERDELEEWPEGARAHPAVRHAPLRKCLLPLIYLGSLPLNGLLTDGAPNLRLP
jgi:hypothetical protein